MAQYEPLRRGSAPSHSLQDNALELQPLTRNADRREGGSGGATSAWARRGDFWTERRRHNIFGQSLSLQSLQLSKNRVYIGAVAVAAAVAVAYILLDVRVHVEVHRPCICPNVTACRPPGPPPPNVTGGGAAWGPARWQGYDSYLQALEPLVTLPAVAEAQQLKVTARGPYGYAQFSSYRLSADAFASVGFGARHLKDLVQVAGCRWQSAGSNGTLAGRTEVLYNDEHWDRGYDAVIIRCLLEGPTPNTGGYAATSIGGEELIFYREEEGREHVLEAPPPAEMAHFATVCTPAAAAAMEPRAAAEFLEYHKKLGAAHFVLYDGGALDRQLAAALGAQLAAGVVEVVPFRDVQRYDLWRDGYYLSLHDCIYRSRLTSKWVLVANWDEYLWVRPPETLLSLLGARDGKAWLTHGAAVWAISHCRPGPPIFDYERLREDLGSSQPFSIERMVFHWPNKAVCHDPGAAPSPSLCLGMNGARKYILDPRQVAMVHVNEIVAPAEGGEDLDFELAHHQTFQDLHLAANFTAACHDTWRDDAPPDWWVRDLEEAEFAAALRRAPYPVPLPRG